MLTLCARYHVRAEGCFTNSTDADTLDEEPAPVYPAASARAS